jgi:hypothetical protein
MGAWRYAIETKADCDGLIPSSSLGREKLLLSSFQKERWAAWGRGNTIVPGQGTQHDHFDLGKKLR